MSGLEEAMVLLPIIKNDILLNLFAYQKAPVS